MSGSVTSQHSMLPSFGNLTKVLLEMSALAAIFIREPSCATFYILLQVLEVYIMHDTFTVYIMTSYLHNLPIGFLYNFL